jgi:hypothetical protein
MKPRKLVHLDLPFTFTNSCIHPIIPLAQTLNNNNIQTTYVDDDVTPGHERAATTSQEHGQVVKLLNGIKTLHGGALDPEDLLRIQGLDTVQRGIHVSGANGVDPYAVLRPLGRQRLPKHYDACFGGVVRSLLLWPVDDMAGHRGNEDTGSAGVGLDHSVSDRLSDDERADQMNIGVVRSLLLWPVHDVTGHRREEDHGATRGPRHS